MYGHGLVMENCLKYMITMWAMPAAVVILKTRESTFFTERLIMQPVSISIQMGFSIFGVII